jgi:single-strand DNA-binding protein
MGIIHAETRKRFNMPSFNKVILIGNLTADPELRYLPKGTAVAQFNVACNRRWKDESGQQKDEVTFIGVKAWDKQAETIFQYLKKGRPIMIEGRLTQEEWQDKQSGTKRSKTLVTLESFQFLDSGGGNQGQSQQTQRPVNNPVNNTAAPSDDLPPDDGSDVPF